MSETKEAPPYKLPTKQQLDEMFHPKENERVLMLHMGDNGVTMRIPDNFNSLSPEQIFERWLFPAFVQMGLLKGRSRNETKAIEPTRISIEPIQTEAYDAIIDKVRPVIQIGWIARFMHSEKPVSSEYSIHIQDDIWLVAAKDIEP